MQNRESDVDLSDSEEEEEEDMEENSEGSDSEMETTEMKKKVAVEGALVSSLDTQREEIPEKVLAQLSNRSRKQFSYLQTVFSELSIDP